MDDVRGGFFTASTRHNTSCSEVKINLKEFLQEQKLRTLKWETWTILRCFGYSSLISDPDMIWWKPEIDILKFLKFDKEVDSMTELYQKLPKLRIK